MPDQLTSFGDVHVLFGVVLIILYALEKDRLSISWVSEKGCWPVDLRFLALALFHLTTVGHHISFLPADGQRAAFRAENAT